MGNKIKNKKYYNLFMDLLFDIIGSIFYSVGIYTFAKMANFAPGGISGLALMINYIWKLPIGITNLMLNIPLVLISYRVVGKNFLIKSARTMIFCTVFLDLVFPHLPVYTGSPLLAGIYYGMFTGAGLALFYMRGSSSGGTDFLTMTIKALRPHLSLGFVMLAIDLVIITMGWFVFGNIDAILYGLISVIVTSIALDKIMYGMGATKLAIIITTKGQEVADHISKVYDRGSTAIKAMGTYSKTDRDVLLCACSSSQAYIIKNAVHEIDPSSFIMLADTSEIYGEGFLTK